MRQLLSLLIFSLIYFIASSFLISRSLKNSLDLQTAINQKKITAEIKSNGNYSDESVDYVISNNTNQILTIKIPSGTLFHPKDSGEQTLVLIQENVLTLKSKEKREGTFNAYCTESNDNCPTSDDEMTLGRNTNPQLDSLLQHFRNNKINSSQYQQAIWCVTDGKNVSNIVNNSHYAELREYVSELTGQENTWYSTPQNVQVNSNGSIVSTTKAITGEISFHCNKGTQVFQDVHDGNGQKLISTEPYRTVRDGKITYTFTIKVKGWDEGNYYVRLHDGRTEIKKYSFQI
tara:strand:+ start:902 stop:1768 length:867 start_codon:yes stop_codon:yes gene_type:complete